MSSNLPRFVIAGASFSGAEILYELLKSNPALFFPKGKPSAFFYRDNLYARGIEPYQKLFENVDGHRVAGDLGIHYFEHGIVLNAEKKYCWKPREDSALRLKKHCEAAKIILCLRHPLERAYLQFKQAKISKIETAQNLEEALREELNEKRNPQTHPLCYLYRNRLGFHVAHWRRVFGAAHVKILFYEELIANMADSIKTVEGFIGVRPYSLDPVNIAKARGNIPITTEHMLNFLKRFPALEGMQNIILSRLRPKYKPSIKFSLLDSKPYEHVTALFSRDISELEILLGREDISSLWPLPGNS